MKFKFVLALIFVLSFTANIYSVSITINVNEIVDGDTIRGLYYELPMTVRLAHIDTPEIDQKYGAKAKSFTKKLTQNKPVKIDIISMDRYGRYVAVVTVDNQNLNRLLVQNGLAWWYQKYSTKKIYSELQSTAKKARIGLWKQKKPIAPWEFRKSK